MAQVAIPLVPLLPTAGSGFDGLIDRGRTQWRKVLVQGTEAHEVLTHKRCDVHIFMPAGFPVGQNLSQPLLTVASSIEHLAQGMPGNIMMRVQQSCSIDE